MTRRPIACAALLLTVLAAPAPRAGEVSFAYAPPEWQTAICLPDDPHKTLVDRGGDLLYHYRQGGREFGTRVGVEVVPGATWRRQVLHSARVPIVRTLRSAEGLDITEEAFAVTDLPAATPAPPPPLVRRDGGGTNRAWAKPPPGTDPALADIAVHMNGGLRFDLAVPRGGTRRVALALCEGWWREPGKRVQVLRVEGARERTVDTVADLGPNKPGAFWFDARDANGDGAIEVAIDPAPAAADKNTILNGLYAFAPDVEPDDQALLAGKLNARATARLQAAGRFGPARNDVILVRVANTGAQARTLSPRLIIDTTLPFDYRADARQALVDGYETVTASLGMTAAPEGKGPRRSIPLEPLAIPAGGHAEFFVLYSAGGQILLSPATLDDARQARERSIAYWEKAPLPYGRVQVPDPAIQAQFDSAVRNIWQAREIKKGLPAFQVGPTCYRGLWIVDGAFLLEAAALLGAGDQARGGVAYELTYQQPDGRIEVMRDFSKENGIVLWTCVRHAQLTQDRQWLESVWPRLGRIAEHLKALRRRTLENDTPLDDGLVPPGFPDGGIGGVHAEYTNVYWNLAGLKALVGAARWLGKADEAARWQAEYDDFLAAFRKAAARDLSKDDHGNAYLPALMGEAGRKQLPQRAQWAFCHAVYPGQVFDKTDPLVAGTLAMLRATERQGMVYGTGWDASGIWNYFASFYAHAWLWQGDGAKAAELLYAYADHAAPTLVWREEQSLRGEKFKKVGDMPHNWASAEFIRLVVHLLALDRGDELHLLEGLPRQWLAPGMVTRLDGVATPFGPLKMTLRVDPSGKSASLQVAPLARNCSAVVVHLPGGARGAGGTQSLVPTTGGTLTIPLDRN